MCAIKRMCWLAAVFLIPALLPSRTPGRGGADGAAAQPQPAIRRCYRDGAHRDRASLAHSPYYSPCTRLALA
jgi:hypothetical protein